MAMKPVVPGLYILPGLVNLYLLETPEGDALIDTGFPRSAEKTLEAIRSIGKSPENIRHIILTHAHPDHIGSAAVLKRTTSATVYAHATDAPIIEGTSGRRKTRAAPGIRNWLMTKILIATYPKVEPTKVDRLIADGEALPFASDLTAIHSPGHSAGQVALMWDRHGGVLFMADICINRNRLQLAAAQEDVDVARSSIRKLSMLDFEVACFGHGPPIMSGANIALRERLPF